MLATAAGFPTTACRLRSIRTRSACSPSSEEWRASSSARASKMAVACPPFVSVPHDRQPGAAMDLQTLPLRLCQDGLDDGGRRFFLAAKDLGSGGIAEDDRDEIAARLEKAPHRVFRCGRGWIVLDFRRRDESIDQRLPRRNRAADPVRAGVRRERMRLQHLRRHGLAIEIGEAVRNERERNQPRRRERNDDAPKKADLQPAARLGGMSDERISPPMVAP